MQRYQQLDGHWSIVSSDAFLFLGGVCLGVVLTIFLFAFILQNVYISPHTKDNKDLNIVNIVDEDTGREFLYWNPRTFKQTIELFASFTVWRIKRKTKQKYILHAEDKAKGVLTVLIILALSIFFISAYFILTITPT